jgi:hypothetical protein
MIKTAILPVIFGIGCWGMHASYPDVWAGFIGFAIMFGAMSNADLIMAAFLRDRT